MDDASKAETSDRVEWAMTRNLSTQDPNWAWHEMYETYAAQGALKAAAGVDARGRKNTRPVLHYTLSWHERDQPTAEEMKQAALDSLKVLGLREHEAVIASHKDKQHMHVHIVVNTVHPETGLTAPMRFSKLELSKWAEGYEILNGLHCDARMKNNAERARLKAEREREALDALLGAAKGQTPKKRVPYVPVKDRQTSRKEWFDRKEITDRAKALRDALWQEFRQRGDALWDRQQKEWEAATGNTQSRVNAARASVRAKYQPRWRNLYFTQKKQARQIARIAESPLDRAAFVYQNRDWLGMPGKPLTPRLTLALVTSGPRLMKHVAGIHERERQALARESKTETKSLTEAIWAEHKSSMRVLKEHQTAERETLRDNRSAARKSISWDDAKASLAEERAKIERPFEAPPGPMEVTHRFHEAAHPSQDQPSTKPAISRAEQIKRDAAAWLKRHQDRDFGRDM